MKQDVLRFAEAIEKVPSYRPHQCKATAFLSVTDGTLSTGEVILVSVDRRDLIVKALRSYAEGL